MNEAKLERAVIKLIEAEGYTHTVGSKINRALGDVLIKADLIEHLLGAYRAEGLSAEDAAHVYAEVEAISREGNLYKANKRFCGLLSGGLSLPREEGDDLHVRLIHDDERGAHNIYRVVSQVTIQEPSKTPRRPDLILYINGLPLVVIELKSATREKATIHDAYVQITTRYQRDIPKLFVYNALCVISDGVNSKMGSLFAPYEFFYAWRKITGEEERAAEGIDSLKTMIRGLFNPTRLQRVARHFIYFPDESNQELKVVCRYPQFYAANKLLKSVEANRRPHGKGKGGTYFGATGSGKSYTMLFLSRLLMKSPTLDNPTILLITDRLDLHEQLSGQIVNAKVYLGDVNVVGVESRADLKAQLRGIQSGGVFLTTIQRFSEDTDLLTERSNVICISDEAHRSQHNLTQKVKITDDGVKTSYGFAYYLHQSLPNAVYVGFTGTPIDASLNVFGEVVDRYTMTESVQDEITVAIVYEGRAAKVILNNDKLAEIEAYYAQCEVKGSNQHQIEASKKAMAQMRWILGDPQRIQALVEDFVAHYEARIAGGGSVLGKAMLVLSAREIAWDVYQALKALRPGWFEERPHAEGLTLSKAEQKKVKPSPMIRLVMTRNKDDDAALYRLLGDKGHRRSLADQFKENKSNFKIAIVVDMWLTGFDVPALDTMYVDKPLSRHNLIQTISRVNRRYPKKNPGLIVDYFGFKKAMNLALAHYSKEDKRNIKDIEISIVAVRNSLDLLRQIFVGFDNSAYFGDDPLAQLQCLKLAGEFIMRRKTDEARFMKHVKVLKLAYEICAGSGALTPEERDQVHFYLAVRAYIFKLTRGEAPDTAQMNKRVAELIAEALASDGVEEIVKLGTSQKTLDLFGDDYLDKIKKIKLPHTKINLLKQLLKQALLDAGKINQVKATDFSARFKALVKRYNERKENSKLVSDVLEDLSDQFILLFEELRASLGEYESLGISFEEQAFYDILVSLAGKYDFTYPKEKLISLSREVKAAVDDKTKYVDWNIRDNIKAELRVSLILLLAKWGYPPIAHDDVYKEIFEQAENFKKHRA